MTVKKLKTVLYEFSFFFFPSRCCACGRVVRRQADLCTACLQKILRVPQGKFCKGCGQAHKNCLCTPEPFLSCICAPFLYEGDLRKQVQRFKFFSRPAMAVPYAKIAAKYLQDSGNADGIDMITFIPMTENAVRKRGYNQAEEFAKALAAVLGIPCQPLLVKTHETPQQHTLPAILRHGNLTGIYELPQEKEECIKDKVILLADDITTTGSTLHEAAKTLLIFGAKEVRGICIARAAAYKQMIL